MLTSIGGRTGFAIRLAGLIAVSYSVSVSTPAPGTGGRGLVVLIALALTVGAWLAWTLWSSRQSTITPDLFVLAGAGAFLTAASTGSAASACVFIAVMAASIREGFTRGLPVLAMGIAAIGTAAILYDFAPGGVLAFGLGFAAAMLGGANIRQTFVRAEQAELLLAQAQRSHEEQVRAARLEESARIAREIHDVLAHTLAGLTIQLEATEALLDTGADRATIGLRLRRAHELARDGLRETRRAVGALRGDEWDPVELVSGLEAMVADYRESVAAARLELEGDVRQTSAPAAEAILRVVQECLTNARKHASGAAVEVSVRVGAAADGWIEVTVINDAPSVRVGGAATAALADSGGGYGLRGMRERAEGLGGEITAGPHGDGWQVSMRLPGSPLQSGVEPG